MQTIEPNIEEEKRIEGEKALTRSSTVSCLKVFIVLAVIAGVIALVFYIIHLNTQDGNLYNEELPGIFGRPASLNDITITGDEFNLSSFGGVLTFNPKHDIDNLTLTFEFVNGKKVIQTIKRKVGNVVKGNQYKVTISIADLSWDVIKNAFNIKCQYYVSSGTTMVFN